MAIVVASLVILAAACSGDRVPRPHRQTGAASGGSTTPATTSFPAVPADQISVPVGDQIHQSLSDVAANGSVVIAVGQDVSANLSRPLFLRSTDAGQTWQRVREDPADQDSSGTGQRVSDVAHGPSGFVALGAGVGNFIIWRSKDGRRWQRSEIDNAIMRRDESVSDLVATPDGFMIIGQSRRRHGNQLGSLLTWSSADGRHWTRQEIPSSVLGGSVGVPSLTQLVAGEHELIMTGDLENSGDTERPNRILILRSTDHGASWTKIDFGAGVAGRYRAYAEHLSYVNGQYLLLAQGSGADPEGDSWDSLVLSGGPHGTSWQRASVPRALGSNADDYGRVLLQLPADGQATKQTSWLVGGSVGRSPSDGLIAVGAGLGELHRLQVAPLTGSRSQSISGGVVSDGAAVLIGSDGRTGSDDPMILRVRGSAVTRVQLGDLAGVPVPVVSQVVDAGNGYRAVGSLNGTPSLWTSPNGLDWAAHVLPARGHDGVTEASADDVAAGPGHTAVAVGTLDRSRGSRLGVWTIDANGRAQQVRSKAFVSPTPDDYGYLQATAITYGSGGWVISAEHYADGRNDLWLLHSADGRHWTPGRGTEQVHLDRDEQRDHRTVWAAFRAPANGDIEADQVVAVGQGFVAVGAIHDKGVARPVAWRSNDGVTWGEPEDLPLPPGVTDVGIGAAVAAGMSVIVSGQSVPQTAAQDRHWMSWRLDLTDMPRIDQATWQLGTDVVADSSISSITALAEGFIGVGSATVDGAADARWWRSSDGLHWRPVPVPHGRTSGPGNQRIEGVLESDDGLLLWGWDVPPTGGGDYTTTVAIPR